MRREVEGRLNTFLLNPKDFGKVYCGVSDKTPTSTLGLFGQDTQKSRLQEGLDITYTTTPTGQYEIIAYPKDFGYLSVIHQNNIDINIIEAWTILEIKENSRDYYLYYTQLPQFDDLSIFMFQL